MAWSHHKYLMSLCTSCLGLSTYYSTSVRGRCNVCVWVYVYLGGWSLLCESGGVCACVCVYMWACDVLLGLFLAEPTCKSKCVCVCVCVCVCQGGWSHRWGLDVSVDVFVCTCDTFQLFIAVILHAEVCVCVSAYVCVCMGVFPVSPSRL